MSPFLCPSSTLRVSSETPAALSRLLQVCLRLLLIHSRTKATICHNSHKASIDRQFALMHNDHYGHNG